jgi:predicted peptidase
MKKNKMKRVLLNLCSVAIIAYGLFPQSIQQRESDQRESPFVEGDLSRIITKRISVRYMAHLPGGYAGTKDRWPLLIYLHGGRGRGSDFQKLYWYPIPKMILENKFPDSFVVVIPQCPEGKDWTELIDALEVLIGHMIDNFRIDTSRIYGIGYSMGGNGIAYFAYTHPGMFSAIVPMSGEYFTTWASRLGKVPCWFFHGAKDTIANIDRCDRIVEELRKFNDEVKYTRDPQGIHSPPTMEQHLEISQWLLKHSKGHGVK